MTHEASTHTNAECRRIVGLLDTYLDGELAPEPSVEVEQALAECEQCRCQLELLQAIRLSTKRVVEEQAIVSDAFRARLAQALAEESERQSHTGPYSLEQSVVGQSLVARGTTEPDESRLSSSDWGASRGSAAQGTETRWAISRLAVPALAAAAVWGVFIWKGQNPLEREDSKLVQTGSDGEKASKDNSAGARSNADRRSPDSARVAGALPVSLSNDGEPHFDPLDIVEDDKSDEARKQANRQGLGVLMQEGNAVREQQRAEMQAAANSELLDTLIDDHSAPPDTPKFSPQRSDITPRLEKLVGVHVRLPELERYGAQWRGVDVVPVSKNSRAASLRYALSNRHRVTVYAYNPARVPVRYGKPRRVGQDQPVYVGYHRGYSVATFERRGVGYTVASDLDDDTMVELVGSIH